MDSILNKKTLDRINRIFKISFGHSPDESGQTPSPSAKVKYPFTTARNHNP
jgi:hypothetical protein